MSYALITPPEQPVPSLVPERHQCQGRAICLGKPSLLLGLLALDRPVHVLQRRRCPLSWAWTCALERREAAEHTGGVVLPIAVTVVASSRTSIMVIMVLGGMESNGMARAAFCLLTISRVKQIWVFYRNFQSQVSKNFPNIEASQAFVKKG